MLPTGCIRVPVCRHMLVTHGTGARPRHAHPPLHVCGPPFGTEGTRPRSFVLRGAMCGKQPDNIMFRAGVSNAVKVIDFGVSIPCKQADVSAGATAVPPRCMPTYFQTRPYRAPEVVLGLPYSQVLAAVPLQAVIPSGPCCPSKLVVFLLIAGLFSRSGGPVAGERPTAHPHPPRAPPPCAHLAVYPHPAPGH